MMPMQPGELSEAATVLCAVAILLLPLAVAGLALINTGFGRGRNAAHSMICAISVFSVAALVYLAVGFSLQSYPGGPSLALTVEGRSWSLLGAAPLMMGGHLFDQPALALLACLQLFAVGLAAVIPLGAGSGRWRLGACCASSALLAAIVYPLFAHWVWGGGWLAQLGQLERCGSGALDLGGAAVIQAIGGISALCVLWILGPRQGKYEISGMAIPALLSVAYAGLIAAFFAGSEGGFSSIEAVRTLFQSDALLVAGWLHYLAFDLFVGAWEVRTARAEGIPHLSVIPCLALTFLMLRAAYARRATLAMEA